MKFNLRPSLFDIQVNGFAGVDFQDPRLKASDLRRSCIALRRCHTHRILLTLITDSIGSLEAKFRRIEAMRAEDPLVAETIAGYHLEGPYLSPEEGYRGAHLASYMKGPELREFRQMQKAANGNIRLLTIAPEWPGSAAFIAAVVSDGVVVSLGHTNADNGQIDKAVRAGATMCTHLGNGCRMLVARHDNIIQRLLARDDLVASFIPDGIHIAPFVLKNFLRAKPAGKVVVTTDAVAAAAASPGPFYMRRGARMARFTCGRDGVIAFRGRSGYLCGSSLTLDRGVANLHRWIGLSYDTAWDLASRRPARIFGITLPKIKVPVTALLP